MQSCPKRPINFMGDTRPILTIPSEWTAAYACRGTGIELSGINYRIEKKAFPLYYRLTDEEGVEPSQGRPTC
jgi:hypothetical protein